MERRRFRESLEGERTRNQAISSCITRSVLTIRPTSPEGGTGRHTLSLAESRAVQIPGSSYSLSIAQFLQPGVSIQADEIRIELVGYAYALTYAGQEVVAFHWHTTTPNTPGFPHLHVGPAVVGTDSLVRRGNAHKVHFPTGIVPLEQFVYLAITEFGVQPRRDDWEAILGVR